MARRLPHDAEADRRATREALLRACEPGLGTPTAVLKTRMNACVVVSGFFDRRAATESASGVGRARRTSFKPLLTLESRLGRLLVLRRHVEQAGIVDGRGDEVVRLA